MSNCYMEYNIPFFTKRLIIVTDIHNCHIEWHGITNEDRMKLFCDTMKDEYQRQRFDGIISLGDYSLDFWKWSIGGSYLWDEPVSRTAEFVDKYRSEMPTDFYMIPGNHEQYGHEDWERITGYPREYSIVWGEVVFVMLDTFGGELDPKENHDGSYTGINVELLKTVIERHHDKKIILCMHDLVPLNESEEARELILSERRIVCAFTGHTHKNNVQFLDEKWRFLPVVYCGDFSYTGGSPNKNWGYRMLELNPNGFSTTYVRVQ